MRTQKIFIAESGFAFGEKKEMAKIRRLYLIKRWWRRHSPRYLYYKFLSYHYQRLFRFFHKKWLNAMFKIH